MKIIIINGCAQSGKDTFVTFCQEIDKENNNNGYKRIYNRSTIDPIKNLALQIGWDGEKNERSRLFLSDLKDITSAFCNYSTNWLISEIKDIENNGGEIVFVHSREPEDIDSLKKILGEKGYEVHTLIIRRDKAENNAPNNHADREVLNYNYEASILNNTTLENLKLTAKIYLKQIDFIK